MNGKIDCFCSLLANFNSLMVRLDDFYNQKLSQDFQYFNSLMVRLDAKAQPTLVSPKIYFNSLMVRLDAASPEVIAPGHCQFQFLNGAIGCVAHTLY